MNVLIVLAHPERQSFNGALADVAAAILKEQGHQVLLDDLYGEGFDPVERPGFYPHRDKATFAPLTEQRRHHESGGLAEEVTREIQRLEWADLLILQFPLWWHAQPAILKGWFDRVLVYGGLYTGQRRYNRGHFRGRRAICSVTAGSPEKAFMPFGRAGNMAEWLWPIHSSLYYVGYDVLPPEVNYGVQGGGIKYQDEGRFREQLEQGKVDWEQRLAGLQTETAIPFTGWEDWDDQGVLGRRNPQRWRL